MICAFSEPARTVGRATVNPQYCRCLKLRLEKKKNWCFPLSWKGNFPVGTKIDRGEKFKGSQKNCRLRNFIHSRKKKSPRENLCGQNRWFETSRNFSSQQQKIIGMKNIAECYKNWAIGDFMLTRERSPEIPASIVICAWAMAVFQ